MKSFKRISAVGGVILLLGLALVWADESVDTGNPRQCYSCEGINCLRPSKLNATQSCSDLLDICVTIFNDYAVVAKGCYLDMPDTFRAKCDERNNPECSKCFGQLCNNKGRSDYKCIQCNSKDNSKCTTDTSDMSPVQCPIPTATNSYCYVRESEDHVLSRGCCVHLADQMDCMKDGTCSMCLSGDGEACNSFSIIGTRSGARSIINISLFGIISVVLTNLFN